MYYSSIGKDVKSITSGTENRHPTIIEKALQGGKKKNLSFLKGADKDWRESFPHLHRLLFPSYSQWDEGKLSHVKLPVIKLS